MKEYLTLKSCNKDYVALPEGKQTLWLSLDIFLLRQTSEIIENSELPKDSIGYMFKKGDQVYLKNNELNLRDIPNLVHYNDCITKNIFDIEKYHNRVIDYLKRSA